MNLAHCSRTLGLVLLSTLAAAGCTAIGPFECSSNLACTDHGVQGNCLSGRCAFPDAACVGSKQRFVEASGASRAGECVPANACVQSLAGGGATTCALKTDGTVWCWGDGTLGSLGDGTTVSRDAPAQVTALGGKVVKQLAAGLTHMCARLDDGTLWCWGSNADGQLGLSVQPAPASNVSSVPVKVPLSGLVTDLSSGGKHTCVVVDAMVWCWGENADYQVASDGTTPDQIGPIQVKNFADVKEARAGDEHTCALTLGGQVWCWGSNALGQCGQGAISTPLLKPTQVLGLLSIAEIALGDEHTCALNSDSTLLCWGANTSGGVGNGSTDNQPSPVLVFDGVAQTTASSNGKQTCALRADGTLWCWGANDRGQLGIGDPEPKSLVPAQVKLAQVAVAGAGSRHTCAATLDGALWCWGDGRAGQLGLPTADSFNLPQRVTALTCP